MELTLKEILKATNGKLVCGDINTKINSVSTSSCEIGINSLFVPIKGEKVDAHDFIDDAFINGAVATLTSRENCYSSDKSYILVDDTKKALQHLASYYREKFSIPIIGITGSVGKTTTKEMVSSALSAGGKVMKTIGNQNSQIGVPLTMLRLDETDDFAVVELGMSEFGEMQRISEVAKVSHAIITNIGISHIENLHSQENILKEKLHIADHFKENSIIYLNGDDELLAGLKNKTNFKIVFFGTKDFCDYRAENIKEKGNSTSFDLIYSQGKVNIQIPTIGFHNVLNALASIAVCTNLGFSMAQIQKGLDTFKQPKMRQQIIDTGFITVIDDSYNASPDSIKSGISVLKSISNNQRTIAVLGDMLELGEYSFNAHFDLGKYLAENNIDIVITVGKEAKAIADGAKSKNSNILAMSFENNQDVINYLRDLIKQNDKIIVKGSRGMHTDEIVSYLLEIK